MWESDPKNCPKCGADFKGEAIPDTSRQYYGTQTHFSRVVGISDITADRITDWRCPDCMHVWPRAWLDSVKSVMHTQEEGVTLAFAGKRYRVKHGDEIQAAIDGSFYVNGVKAEPIE